MMTFDLFAPSESESHETYSKTKTVGERLDYDD